LIEVRRRAEEKGYEMRMAPFSDIAAQAHEGVETLTKVVEVSKKLRGDLKGKLWEATITLLAAN
jgi:hypothetical protein